jgi:hypothetical protein
VIILIIRLAARGMMFQIKNKGDIMCYGERNIPPDSWITGGNDPGLGFNVIGNFNDDEEGDTENERINDD